MDFEASLERSIGRSVDWLEESGLLGKPGELRHAVFFVDEAAAGMAVEALDGDGMREGYRDTGSGDDFPIHLDLVGPCAMTREGLRGAVDGLLARLRGLALGFDYNGFTLLVDLEDEDENTEFFDPSA